VTGVASAHQARGATPRRRGSIRAWLAVRALLILSAILSRLPQEPLGRVAFALGGALYRVQPARRRLVRGNLERVCTYLAAHDLGGPRVAAAARDTRALDALVRAAFGHYLRSYLEGATLRRFANAQALGRMRADDAALVAEAFPEGRSGPLIIIGLHFGSIEIPGLWVVQRGLRVTAPMETVADPEFQSYFERTRGVIGLNVIPIDGAAPRLRAALARAEMIALVADRPLGGSGARVELFGAPTRLPLGPAALALESNAPAWVVATRRDGDGLRTYLEHIGVRPDGSTRERLSAFLEHEARAFERAIAAAPEQWWTMFFQIWDDIDGGAP